MTLEQRDQLIDAITEYGRAERAFGRDVGAGAHIDHKEADEKTRALFELVFAIYQSDNP